MEIVKSHWHSRDNSITLSVPITKVDQERRIVSGFATLDNLDRQGDIVTSDASKAAFETFAGNVREMHDKIAAGRVVSFREQLYFDPETQKIYEGIYVDVYVSRGAESTWLKVLDGTLTGFSIGGMITDQEQIFDEELGQLVNVVKAYMLSELSIVDAPANQLANVFSVQKMADGTQEVSGIAVDVKTVDVFWCADEKVATIGEDNCSICGQTGEKIGWIESNLSVTEKTAAVASLIKNTAKPAVEKEEGVEQNMADETVEKADETVTPVDEVVIEKSDSDNTADATAEAGAEATTDEVVAPEAAVEVDWQAELASLRSTLGEVGTALAGIAKAVATTTEALTEYTEKNDAKVEALGASLGEAITKSQEKANEVLEGLTARVGGVEKSIVVKKSADRDGTPVVTEQRDIWADRFTVHSL